MAFILKFISVLITCVGSPSPQYPQLHEARVLATPHFRSPCSGVTRVCAAQDGQKNCRPVPQSNISNIAIRCGRKAYLKLDVI